MTRKRASEQPSSADRMKQFGEVAKQFKGWRPAREALEVVRAVKTVFPQLNEATRVGGWPIQRISLVHGPSNNGKAQPDDEPVLTPRGFVAICKLKMGDIVIDGDGAKAIVDGIFPQGTKPIYRVELNDGSWTRCCAEHLWLTTTNAELNRKRYVRDKRPSRKRIKTGLVGNGSVKSTADIAATLDLIHYVPLSPVIKCFPVATNLPIDPYILGLLLGDGSFRASTISFVGDDDELHNAISEWANSVGDYGSDATYNKTRTSRIVSNKYRLGGKRSYTALALEMLGLWGHRSETKFVPIAYLFASFEQRAALLRGLLDTDGWVEVASGCAGFCSTSVQLRDAVLFLVRSLGGRATWYCKETEVLDAYIVNISFDDFCPFLLKRKAKLWPKRKKAVRRRIINIIPCGESHCTCIKISSESGLYITRDFIVTHNTAVVHGLGLSFLLAGHYYAYVDAEMTTPSDWIERLMGKMVDSPAFVAMRPRTYEETVDAVRSFAETISEARAKGKLPPDTTALIAVDSLRKLVPERLKEKILKGASGKGGSIDGMAGRAAQYKAFLNSAWLDELVPLMAHSNMAMLIVGREAENDDPFAENWKLTGGKGLEFDSSLIVRVSRDSWVKRADDIVGERLRVRIRKTKIAGKDDRVVDCFVHLSNGVMIPEGFDRARDVLEIAIELGVIEQKGAWYSRADTGEMLGQGESAVVHVLTNAPDMLAEIEQLIDQRRQ